MKETKQQKCNRIAKEMRQDFLDVGIPEEQHAVAVAMILSYLGDIKGELQRFYEGCKRGISARHSEMKHKELNP